MRDNSKPCIFAVKDRYEMMDLGLVYPLGTIYYVTDEKKCFTQMMDGTFVEYNAVLLPEPTPVSKIKESLFYPDEDTYRI